MLPYEVPGVVAGLMLGVAVTGCPFPGVRLSEHPSRATVRIIEIGKTLRICCLLFCRKSEQLFEQGPCPGKRLSRKELRYPNQSPDRRSDDCGPEVRAPRT